MEQKQPVTLPPEIWAMIARYSADMSFGYWDIWLHTRLVSRLFKNVIEDYFLSHYIKKTIIWYEAIYKRNVPRRSFQFDSLDDHEPRKVVFAERGSHSKDTPVGTTLDMYNIYAQ